MTIGLKPQNTLNVINTYKNFVTLNVTNFVKHTCDIQFVAELIGRPASIIIYSASIIYTIVSLKRVICFIIIIKLI